MSSEVALPICKTWKEKNLDYEIETSLRLTISPSIPLTWKEKNLDYEIETQCSP